MTLEILVMWAAVTGYAVAGVLALVGFVFGRDRIASLSPLLAALALVSHGVGVVVRWERLGHGPVLGFYEAISSTVLVSVAVFLVVVIVRRNLVPLGALVFPVSFLSLGAAMLAPRSPIEMSARLSSWWLTVHVMFAKLAYSAFIIAFALGIVYLVRERVSEGMWASVLGKLPGQESVDDLTFRFVAVGFVFLGIMIASGAVWANEAWGRYWAWDPIETWSLVSWLVYAVYMHLRLTMGWRGRKMAWFAVLALPLVVFTLFGVPLVYNSIHGAYLTG